MPNAASQVPEHRELWKLPDTPGERFRFGLKCMFTRRCPYCGSKGIFENYFMLHDNCPTCGVAFEREDGYFLGAYAFNLIFAEFLGLGLALVLIFMTPLREAEFMLQWLIIVGLALLFPLVLFPYSRGVWMAMDLAFHPPDNASERQLRGNLMRYDDSVRRA